jgi:hypothetical protein
MVIHLLLGRFVAGMLVSGANPCFPVPAGIRLGEAR